MPILYIYMMLHTSFDLLKEEIKNTLMVNINFHYSPDVSLEQMIGYEMASLIWGQLFTDDINIDILAKSTDSLDANVIGGAIPELHEQHYALFLEYFEADITSAEDQQAYDALQQGNTVDFLLNGDLVGGNTKIKLTTALAKALGMDEAISLDRYVLDDSEHFLDGTIMMNQNFAWDFDYTREGVAGENTLDFLSVALHETGHILGFTSGLDFSLQQDTLYSGRTELSNFSPLDLFRFSAASLAVENPDGMVNDLSIGGVAWFSPDGGETLAAKMSTGKDGDGFQASHWERRYDPLGIMDPTLWYQERASISDLDVLAFDLMGYDLAENAGNVENLFTTESLTELLAQAKVNLAAKLGVTVEWLEANADVSESSLDLIAQMEATVTPESSTAETSTSLSTESVETLDEKELKDFIKGLDKMMKDVYQWWSQNSNGKNSSWQELYEWWAQNSSGKNSSWQELYEWWAQNSNGKNSSWQELYEWWAQNSNSKNSSWQELYEWWLQDSQGKNSWWQEVFFASADEGNVNLEAIELPGQSDPEATYVGVQEITGDNQDEIIGGDATNDLILAGVGDDLIDGAEGEDTVAGGEGNDTVFGFDGNDSIMGGKGDDVISGESDKDALFGQEGDDVLMGGDHDDYLHGGEGRDFLNGNTGHDALVGGAGDDALEGEAGKDLLVGGDGQDIGNGGSGDDFIFGDEYSESLKQAFGDNLTNLTSLFTPTETPVVDNSNSGDTVTGTNELVLAQDPIRVEAESLTWSGNYNSTSKSYASNQTLIRNTTRNQWITGSETFIGTTGVYDIVIGYHDIKYDGGEIQFQLNGTSVDTWDLSQNLYSGYLKSGNFTTHTISNISLTTNDSFSLKSWVNEAGYGEGALDYIEFMPVVENNNDSSNTSNSENTNDVVLGQDPTENEEETPVLNLNNPNDIPVELGKSSDILRGGHGHDGIDGGVGNDIIFGEDEFDDSSDTTSVGGNDTVFGGSGNDQIYGNSGNDLLYGNNTSNSDTSETLSFQQGINGYNGTVDTQIYIKNPNTDYSTSSTIIIDGNDDRREVLIRFEEIFGVQADQITSDKTINSAFLEINVTDRGPEIEIYEMMQNWSDTDTWNSLNNGIQTDGVEASSTPAANITTETEKGIFRIDVTASLQAWQANPNTNHGWAIFLDHSNRIDFDSSESSNAPRLVVDVETQDNDNLTGNGGNDTLAGSAGNDIINGTDEIVAGYSELDVLNGGAGADTFILGDAIQAYYATAGNQDYAVIQDFDSSQDTIQFYGSAGDYQSQLQGNDMLISRNGDLVAILENTNSVNFNASGFEYV